MGMSAHAVRVDRFMELAQQELPKKPTIPSGEVRRFRARFLLEECLETIDALGFDVDILQKSIDNLIEVPTKEPDLVRIVDGCCDLSIVGVGTLLACGVRDDYDYQKEVDFANLRKFEGDAHRRADGKWIKPSNFIGPEAAIRRLLDLAQTSGVPK